MQMHGVEGFPLQPIPSMGLVYLHVVDVDDKYT